ncbi:MAG: methyltransferase domain-containing protein, partial [Planctomycetes bacterium]|nr:methyltransferase domain-containing protein [Planctomycetota bacterium]
MTSLDRQLAHEALTPYLLGTTLQLGQAPEDAIEGATWVDCRNGLSPDTFSRFADASFDSIVAAFAVEWVDDAVHMLGEWRRLLAEGGKLAVVLGGQGAQSEAPHHYTADAWQNLLRAVGGFELVRLAELDDGNGWLVVAERHVTLDLRNLLGSHGAALADAARRGPEQRAELCFQFGTILLRVGELDPAVSCFESMLEHLPENSEGLFGVG